MENVGTKMFLQIYKILLNFNAHPLIYDPTLFPGKNSPNIGKSISWSKGQKTSQRGSFHGC